MSTQWVSLEEAAALIQDGMTLALGGLMLYRRPVAFVRALLERDVRPSSLNLLCFTAGYESDLLVGAGCVATMHSCYIGLEAFGFAPMFTQSAQDGSLAVVEETEASIVLGIQAALAGVPSLPSRAWLGTDMLMIRQDVKTSFDPYTSEEVVAFPAIHCDVAVIHALAADRAGNILLNNNLGIDKELALLADTVIVTVEEQVDSLTQHDGFILPEILIDYLVVTPRGAWPTSCHPTYSVDGHELLRYVDMCTQGLFDTYLQTVSKL